MSRQEFLALFNLACQQFGDKTAVYYVKDAASKGLAVSFNELDKLSNKLCLFFSKHITEANRPYIGVCLSDYFWLPCVLVSIWKNGKAFAGIGSHFSAEQTGRFLENLGVKYVITDNEKSVTNMKLISNFRINSHLFFIWQVEYQAQCVQYDMCYGIMTTGSTGKPKVIQVPWTCIFPNVIELMQMFEMSCCDNIYQSSPYTFDPFFIEIFLALTTGASILIISKYLRLSFNETLKILFESNVESKVSESVIPQVKEDDRTFSCVIKEIKVPKITFLQTTPYIFKKWTAQDTKNTILSANTLLRILVLGGEKFPVDILQLKSCNNMTRIYNIYGITEVSCWAFINHVQNKLDVSLGSPLKDICYRTAENGEFYIGSKKRVCLIDKEKQIPSEYVFRATGDVVTNINYQIHYIGRSNNIIKRYGIKIDIGQIENVFMRQVESICECVCVFDDESQKLGAFVVSSEKTNGKDYLLLDHENDLTKPLQIACSKLTDIQKPDCFIRINSVPVNRHGKCDRKHLLQTLKKCRNRSPGNAQTCFRHVWRSVLSTDLCGGNFIRQGGNSILAIQTIAKLESEHVRVPKTFISMLLSDASFEDCLTMLASSSEVIPTKKNNSETDSVNSDAATKLNVVWTYDLNKCVDAPPSILMSDKTSNVIVGSHSSSLCSLVTENGKENWKIVLGDRIESGVCIDQKTGLGFVGCYDHHVYCIALSAGDVVWKYKTGDMIKSTPCLSTDGSVLFVASYDQHLHCLSAQKGSLIRKLKISNAGIYSSAIKCDSLHTLYIGTLDGTCVSLEQNDQELVWKCQLESPVFASPCLTCKDGLINVIFAEVLGRVHCLSAGSGNKIWSYECHGNVYSSPVTCHVFDVTLVLFGCHDGHIYCLQPESTVKLKWKQRLNSPVFSKPVLIRQGSDWVVSAATTKGSVFLCDVASGSVQTYLQLEGEVFSSPVVHDGRLYVGCRDNNLYCLGIGC